MLVEARNEITALYYEEYLKQKQRDLSSSIVSKEERVPNDTFQSIHDRVKEERNLSSSFIFTYNTCQKRFAKDNLNILDPGKKSPLTDIEPHLVTFILVMADTGPPLSVGQCLPLINSLLHKISHKKYMLHIDNDGNVIPDEDFEEVGVSYWNGLVKRNGQKLTTNKGRLFKLNRTNRTLYRHFCDMYVDIERHLVDAGVAIKLDKPTWMDKERNEVNELESFGMKVETRLAHPHCSLVMDKAGGDTNIFKDISASGGKLFVGRKGIEVRQIAEKKEGKTLPLV